MEPVWSHISEIRWLPHRDISTITLSDMEYVLMQGKDEFDRPYLAAIVEHEGVNKVGFVIQNRVSYKYEWLYGLFGNMDLWYQPSPEQYNVMYSYY